MDNSSLTHLHEVRVYYEDTDAAGVVYYANYLKYVERARTEWMRAKGFELPEIEQIYGRIFVVRKVNAVYQRPARLGDLLQVRTRVIRVRRVGFELEQNVNRNDELLFESTVTLACIDTTTFSPAALPEPLMQTMIHS